MINEIFLKDFLTRLTWKEYHNSPDILRQVLNDLDNCFEENYRESTLSEVNSPSQQTFVDKREIGTTKKISNVGENPILDTIHSQNVIELIDIWFDGRENMERWEWNDLKKSILNAIKFSTKNGMQDKKPHAGCGKPIKELNNNSLCGVPDYNGHTYFCEDCEKLNKSVMEDKHE